ncbi:MAG: GntR family transcriptional regulator [Thermincola sp.]|jgi:GntR family transcriptional regulator|nr:GntR family transcriptional regulator [Thermincola sp.]MDT3703270.1 GntR family transcriptional regulator [Thermincola sp.]
MTFNLDRKKGIPMYLQLSGEIKRLIQIGVWEAGKKVPTERELAEKLNISRNTVSSAYKELEAEGILVSTQGRGTFVTDSDAVVRRESRKELLLKIVDIAIEEAAQLGFHMDEFLVITQARVMAKKEMLSRVRVAFVECNIEQLDHFSKDLNLDPGVSIIPVLLDDFRSQPEETNRLLTTTDLVLTTLFHLYEVKELVKVKGLNVIGLALDPQLETIVKIARLSQGTKLGIVCLSDIFASKIMSSLRRAGIEYLDIYTSTTKDHPALQEFISQMEAIVVSPNRHKEVTQLNTRRIQEIEFRYLPDAGSVNIVKTALLEL